MLAALSAWQNGYEQLVKCNNENVFSKETVGLLQLQTSTSRQFVFAAVKRLAEGQHLKHSLVKVVK
jgi:hypothetical protein